MTSKPHQEPDIDPSVDVLSRHVWGHPSAEQALRNLLEQFHALQGECRLLERERNDLQGSEYRMKEQLEAARRALRDCAALIDARYPEGTTEYQVVLLARAALRIEA